MTSRESAEFNQGMLIKDFANMLAKLTEETYNAVDRANTKSELEKVFRLQAHVLHSIFQTLAFGIDTMSDESLFRLWNPQTKTTTSRN